MVELVPVCGNCFHFKRHLWTRDGVCRHGPPTPILVGLMADKTPDIRSYWPAMGDADHCGQWKPNPNLGKHEAPETTALTSAPVEGNA